MAVIFKENAQDTHMCKISMWASRLSPQFPRLKAPRVCNKFNYNCVNKWFCLWLRWTFLGLVNKATTEKATKLCGSFVHTCCQISSKQSEDCTAGARSTETIFWAAPKKGMGMCHKAGSGTAELPFTFMGLGEEEEKYTINSSPQSCFYHADMGLKDILLLAWRIRSRTAVATLK